MLRSKPSLWSFAITALCLAATAGCGSEGLSEEDRTAVVDTLENYLPLLAESYASGNLEPLQRYASEREVARVLARVTELADEGKYVDATFHRMTVEDLSPLGRTSVHVTTLEVWDLKVVAQGSGARLGEEIGQSSRVKYQLTRRGGRWQVFFRELIQAIQ